MSELENLRAEALSLLELVPNREVAEKVVRPELERAQSPHLLTAFIARVHDLSGEKN